MLKLLSGSVLRLWTWDVDNDAEGRKKTTKKQIASDDDVVVEEDRVERINEWNERVLEERGPREET